MGQAIQQVQQQQAQLATGLNPAPNPPQSQGQQTPGGGGSPVHHPPPVHAGVPAAGSQVAGGMAGAGAAGLGGPQVFNIGGPSSGSFRTSPAVAYAIQQGGVDSKQLGKPGVFNPTDGKSSFLDWADRIITLSDSNMPGI